MTSKREYSKGRSQIFLAVILLWSCPPRHHSWYSHNGSPFHSLLLIELVHVCLYLPARGTGVEQIIWQQKQMWFSSLLLFHAYMQSHSFSISSSLHRNSWMDNWSSYFQILYINETHTHISKTEFVTSFLDLNMSDFYLYILKKYLFIPLLVLCIPILWGPALQCTERIQGVCTRIKL